MSLHADLSPEAELALRKQERKSRILSGVIACLSIMMIAGLLALFAIPIMIVENPLIITYAAESQDQNELQQKKIAHQIQRQQAAPAQNIAQVIAAAAESPVAIPIPDIAVEAPSAFFGDDVDFGQGWGDDAVEGGGASFFGQQVHASRIAYVIDYSRSMVGVREGLMREELARSVSELPPGMLYQLIFFSGPAWVAGDELQQKANAATVKSGRNVYQWIRKADNHHSWDVADSNVQTPLWRSVTSKSIQESLQHIKESKLTLGTVWMPPMQMALRMDPPPQIIYFMTDGIAGPNSEQIAKDIAKLAREKSVIVNTVALMEPRARAAMISLAHETGGQAALIDANGERHILGDK